MSEIKAEYTADKLLADLKSKGLQGEGDTLAEDIKTEHNRQGPPIYLHILAVVGALITAAMLTAFLVEAKLIDLDNKGSLIFMGVILTGVAMAIHASARSSTGGAFVFSSLTSLAFILMGKGLLVAGLFLLFNVEAIWPAAMILTGVTAIVWFPYGHSLDRFMSALAVLLLLAGVVLFEEKILYSREVLFNLFLTWQLAGIALLLTPKHLPKAAEPLLYALLISVSASVIYLATQNMFGDWRNKEFLSPIYSSLILAGGLIFLINWVDRTHNKALSEPATIGMAGVFVLGLVSAPGVIVALGLMILGYHRNERFFVVLGALLTPFFIFRYYYNLDVSLLEKSGILAGTGLLLLLGYGIMRLKGWDKETAS